jgi:hypothetical protein
MDKSEAIRLLGGTVRLAADRIGCTYQAVRQWPDPLPPAIADRVQAALARALLSPELIGHREVETQKPQARGRDRTSNHRER